jgi:hypothetical protein
MVLDDIAQILGRGCLYRFFHPSDRPLIKKPLHWQGLFLRPTIPCWALLPVLPTVYVAVRQFLLRRQPQISDLNPEV